MSKETSCTPVPTFLSYRAKLIDHSQGLAKKHQSFYFFRINTSNVSHFTTQLVSFIPLITTVKDAQGFHKSILDAKKEAEKAGKKAPLLDLVGVNISFSKKGLDVVRHSFVYQRLYQITVAKLILPHS
jgi:hypothetical protein